MTVSLLAQYNPVHAAITTDQAASLVIGQSSLTGLGSESRSGGQDGLQGPYFTAFDSSGNLWVADSANNRVLEFTTPFSNGEDASVVLGQASFTANSGVTNSSDLDHPTGLAFDHSGDLWVVDNENSRVVEYVPGTSPCSTGQFCTHMPASLVIGQSSFTTYNTATSPTGLNGPTGLAFDSSGNLWVADANNARVLEFTTPFSSHEAASLVIGQTSLTALVIATTPTQTGLYFPTAIAFDSSGNLWVADYYNNRVLEYTPSFSTDEAASLVIGQSSFTTNTYATSQNGLGTPYGLAFDSSGNLWVVDHGNNRVLEYTPSFSTDEAASLVIGQSGYTSVGQTGGSKGLYLPTGIAFDSSGNLWVSDTDDNRVVEYLGTTSSPTGTSVSCSPATVDDPVSPSTSTCTATVTGESGTITGETITWTQSAGTGSVSFSPSSTCSLSGSPESCSVVVTGLTAGSPTIQATYPGDSSNAASSGTFLLTINLAPSAGGITSTPSNPIIDVGQSLTLTANPSGGTTPYTYRWYSDGACDTVIAGATSATYSPSATGTYSYTVIDGLGATACSSGYSVTVNSALSAGSVTPSAPSVFSGQTITLTANPSGGTTIYSYQWYSGASATCSSDTTAVGTNSPQYTTAALATGTYYYCYQVTDSAATPVSVDSATDLVTASPAPVPEFPASWALPILFVAAVAVYLFTRQRLGPAKQTGPSQSARKE
jgi:sugar lactone lactonase YvrE